MSIKKLTRMSLGTSLLFAVAFASSLSVGAVKSNETTPAATIRVAPPAPVFDDKARVAELVARRARVAQEIGPKVC